MKNLKFLYPLFFASFPILAFYTYNIEKIRFNKISGSLELSISITVGVWLILNGLLKNRYKTSLLVTYFLVMFYSFGHVYNMLEKFFLKNSGNEKLMGLFLIWIFLLGAGGFLILKLRKGLLAVTEFLYITGFTLVLISLIQVVGFRLNYGSELVSYNYILKANSQFDFKNQGQAKIPVNLPDIYYIILDGYASSEVLNDIYGFNNDSFINFLKGKGFKIATDARSNYALTFLSLASSLNMKYVNYLANIVGEASADRVFASNLIKDNEVLKILKLKGYQAIHFSSGWGSTDSNKFADVNVYCGKINQVETVLLLTTVLKPFESLYLPQNTRERILCTFSELGGIKEDTKGPIFVFSHIVSPHPPYVFGADGEKVEESEVKVSAGLDDWKNQSGYLNQLIFINKKVKGLIEKLTADKKNPPIIIIQADHGSASTPGMEEYNPNLIQERMRPFIAFNFPGIEDDPVLESITPVNIFRFVFNNYFNANYELLENKNYFSNYTRPYRFIDVTKKVKPK